MTATLALILGVVPSMAQERPRCQSKTVIIYTMQGCAECKEAIGFFSRFGVSFQPVDVYSSREAFSMGRAGVPYIVTERGAKRGFDPQFLRQNLCIR